MKRGGANGMTSSLYHGASKKWHRPGVPVLTYFNVSGLAHYARVLFTIGEVDFVDRRITHEEFAQKYKAYSPTGQLPMLEVGEDILTQSSAIALYAAAKANLLLDCPLMMAKAISIQNMLDEMRSEAQVEGSKYSTPEERYKHLAPWLVANAPKTFEMLKKVVESIPATAGSPYIFGKMSFVDVAFASVFKTVGDWLGEPLSTQLSEMCPRMTEAAKAVTALPAWNKVNASYAQPKLTLWYWPMDGRATPIRWAMAYGNIAYEDKTFTREEWMSTYKAQSPTGRAPWLDVETADGKVERIAETNAILAYIGARAKLVPRNPMDASHMYGVMQSCDNVTDMLVSVWKIQDEAEKQKQIAHLNTEALSNTVKRLEEHLKLRVDHTGCVVGGRMTLADFVVAITFGFLNQRHNGVELKDLFTAYPTFLRIYERVMLLPEVQKAMMCHKAKPTVYYFDVTARGSAIKFMMQAANIEYNWVNFNDEVWAKEYKQIPLTGVCPYMDVDGKLIYETMGCVKYVAERANMIPYQFNNRASADALFSVYNNNVNLMMSIYKHPENERDAYIASKRDEFAKLNDVIDKIIATTQSTEGYIFENHMTWIDVYLAGETDWACVRGWINHPVEDKWPHLAKVYKIVYQQPWAKN